MVKKLQCYIECLSKIGESLPNSRLILAALDFIFVRNCQ